MYDACVSNSFSSLEYIITVDVNSCRPFSKSSGHLFYAYCLQIGVLNLCEFQPVLLWHAEHLLCINIDLFPPCSVVCMSADRQFFYWGRFAWGY